DWDFAPDIVVTDGAEIAGGNWRFEAVHTPGHTSNHLCFALPDSGILLSGDHVMGWSTSVIAPPDGDMAAYMASLDQLLASQAAEPLGFGQVAAPSSRLRATPATKMTHPHINRTVFAIHRFSRMNGSAMCTLLSCRGAQLGRGSWSRELPHWLC